MRRNAKRPSLLDDEGPIDGIEATVPQAEEQQAADPAASLKKERVAEQLDRLSLITSGSGLPTLVETGRNPVETVKKENQSTNLSQDGRPAWLAQAEQNIALGAVKSQLGNIAQDKDNEIKALRAQLESAGTVVELDADHIEPSFVRDRMEIGEEAIRELARQIEAQGQIVPILVRPMPDADGHYQVAYGHRRLQALKLLGRKVKAVVKNLSDTELIIAQGQENNARLDLSFIEKARFARVLKARGLKNDEISAALGINNRMQLSWYTKVTQYIPEAIIDAIGPAPEIGRTRWLPLAEFIQGNPGALTKGREIIQEAAFVSKDTNARFVYLANKVTKKEGKPERSPASWKAQDGKVEANVSMTDKRCTLQIDRSKNAGFAEFLVSKLDALYVEYTGRPQAQ
jgi:ParB family transcriptional regulator, chromosome partitioning protein